MPDFFGQTKLVLIPKVPNPLMEKDFRPISCCSVIYKCIAKLLTSRLKMVLPRLIQPTQVAFVKERKILFNVLIFQDIAWGYSRKGISPRCIMKIDLHKAFDSVHWPFIKELLHHLKFLDQFVKWIMACITSISFSIHVNGQQGRTFQGRRGLKQGDPLSPLLFFLTIEYFSRMMKLARLHPDFYFHPSPKKLSLNHLMFADDVLLFCKAHPLTVQLIMQVLKDFYCCSGLQANHSKSVVVFGGCSMALQS